MRILLDTNILGRLADISDPDHRLAEQAIDALRRAQYLPCLTPQSIYEFWVAATRPKLQNGFGMSAGEVAVEILNFKALFPLCEDSPQVFREWEKIVANFGVLGKNAHDARFVASMVVHGASFLLTFNVQDFRRYPQITALSPADALLVTP